MTLLRTGNFRQKDAVVEGFMRSSVVRENDHPLRFAKHFSGSGFLRRGALHGLNRNRGRGCEGRPETVGCRLEGLLASQGAKESVQNLGGFGSDREEFRMPSVLRNPSR